MFARYVELEDDGILVSRSLRPFNEEDITLDSGLSHPGERTGRTFLGQGSGVDGKWNKTQTMGQDFVMDDGGVVPHVHIFYRYCGDLLETQSECNR